MSTRESRPEVPREIARPFHGIRARNSGICRSRGDQFAVNTGTADGFTRDIKCQRHPQMEVLWMTLNNSTTKTYSTGGLSVRLALSVWLAGWGGGAGSAATANHPLDARSAFGAATGTTASFAGFLVEFTTAHFLLDASVLNQLSKPLHCVIDPLVIPQPQLNHAILHSEFFLRNVRSAACTGNRRFASKGGKCSNAEQAREV